MDFWTTRNNEIAPFIDKPANYSLKARHMGSSGNAFNYFLKSNEAKGLPWFSALGFSTSYTAKVSFAPRKSRALADLPAYEEDDWLNWIEGNLLGTHTRKQRVITVADLNWFRVNDTEFRLKAQLVAFTARDPLAYLGDGFATLNAAAIELSPL